MRAHEDLAFFDTKGGLRNAHEALRSVAGMDMSRCGNELTRITGQSVEAIRAQARMSAGFVLDGTTANEIWDPILGPSQGGRFPTWTIADEFAAHPHTMALSWPRHHTIYFRPNYFEVPKTPASLIALAVGYWSVNLLGELTTFGKATALHEVLHKFGLTDSQLFAASNISVLDARTYGTAAISKALAAMCFYL